MTGATAIIGVQKMPPRRLQRPGAEPRSIASLDKTTEEEE